MLTVLLIGLASTTATMIGGFLAGRINDYKHLALGLAGGLMMGVIFFDIVPESLKMSGTLHHIPIAMIMLVIGFTLVHYLERAAGIHHTHNDDHEHRLNPGVLALIGHSFLDGLGIGLAFQVSTTLGVLFAIAVIAHDVGDGFNTVSLAKLYGLTYRRAIQLLAADALAPLLGIIVGTLITVSGGALAALLGLFGGSLLYLATGGIIPEAHASHPTKLTFLFTAIGLITMFCLIGFA